MNSVRREFEENGVAVLKKVWTSGYSEEVCQKIIQNIKTCSEELGCSLEEYLKNVTRWTHPSPVTKDIYELCNSNLKTIATDLGKKKANLVELSVINKSIYANRAIPCHQDISYTPNNPYQFSLWMALQDVTKEDGVLEFLPASHLNKIESAVDFWLPNFIDTMHLSELWRKNFIVFPVQSGDCVIFDSRIWHRSDENKSGHNRFAIVSRWSLEEHELDYTIPEKVCSEFGIWTCGKVTRSLLQKGLAKCFGVFIDGNLATYIPLWIEMFSNEEKIPFKIDISKSKIALIDLLILDSAANLHNAGDMQGVVYAKVWEHLLDPLSIWLKKTEHNI